MSQAEDISAINDYMNRTAGANQQAKDAKASWNAWFKGLSMWAKSFDDSTLVEAKTRKVAFDTANGSLNLPMDNFTQAEKEYWNDYPVTDTTGMTAAQAAKAVWTPKPGTEGYVAAASKPVLKLGSVSQAVKDWQAIVGAKVTGTFDAATKAATITWQAARRLTPDGIVGIQSWTTAANEAKKAPANSPMANVLTVADRPTLRVGSKGEAVKEWQKILGVAADGIFGQGTFAATKVWQSKHALTPDGVVGPNTWKAATAGATDQPTLLQQLQQFIAPKPTTPVMVAPAPVGVKPQVVPSMQPGATPVTPASAAAASLSIPNTIAPGTGPVGQVLGGMQNGAAFMTSELKKVSIPSWAKWFVGGLGILGIGTGIYYTVGQKSRK